MTRALLVLGAGPLELPALRWAREAGLATVVTDSDPQAPGRRLAREFQPLPLCDLDGHLALTRCWQRVGSVVGVLATSVRALRLQAALGQVLAGAAPSRKVVERCLERRAARASWRAAGLPTAELDDDSPRHELTGFFRDGLFVPCSLAERHVPRAGDAGEEWSAQPVDLDAGCARARHALVQRAARCLGLVAGPLQATLVETPTGPALVHLFPGILDLVGATEVAPLAYGKSPLQAWFASLANAGGPFDTFPGRPRAAAGWIALEAPQAGRLRAIAGLEKAQRLPGVVGLWSERPGHEVERARNRCGYLWAQAPDRQRLESRLRAARAALEVRIACKQVA